MASEPTVAGTGVIRLDGAQVGEAGRVLARAFHDDPMACWLWPDDARRARALAWSFRVAARLGVERGEAHTTAGRVRGVAIWLFPGRLTVDPGQLARAGALAAPLCLGPAALGRVLYSAVYFEGLHRRALRVPHWYLAVLGVDPPEQGRGIGSALIQPMLARTDVEGLPCYLETTRERNLPFYRRHGFEVVVAGSLPRGGVRFWTMRREPRRAADRGPGERREDG